MGKISYLLSFLKRYLFATYLGFSMPFREAYTHRYLLLLLIKRDIITRTSGTLLGDAWLLFQPALQIIGFWFLLGIVLNIKFPNNFPFINYFLVSILPWVFISEIAMRSLAVLGEFGGLYQRAVFPIAILPLFPLLLTTLLYALIMSITIGLLEGAKLIILGLLTILVLAIWLIPFCYCLAVIGLFLKDLAQFFPFLITMTLYLTPILYMPDSLPASLKWILLINPIADVMALIHATLQGLPWHWGNLLRPLGLWLLFLGPAWVLFKRAEPHVREML